MNQQMDLIATSIGIINGGNMMFQGSMEELKNISLSRIMIKTRNNKLAQELLYSNGFSSIHSGDSLMFENLMDEEVIQINRTLVADHIDVLRIEEDKKSLERIFLDLTGKEQSL